MNRNLKNEEVKKYITIGAVLIILYWALQNLQLIFSVMSKILTLFMPFLIGGVIAFIMNVPMKQIERHLFQKEQYQTEKFAALRRTCAYVLTLLAIIVILAAAMVIVIPQLVSTIADIVKLIPGQFQNVQQFLMEQAKAYPQIEQQLASVQIDWESLLKSAMDFVTAGTKGIISGGIGAVTSIVSGVTNFFIGFIFSIYVLFQKEHLQGRRRKFVCIYKRKNSPKSTSCGTACQYDICKLFVRTVSGSVYSWNDVLCNHAGYPSPVCAVNRHCYCHYSADTDCRCFYRLCCGNYTDRAGKSGQGSDICNYVFRFTAD